MKKILLIPLGILAGVFGVSQTVTQPHEDARRVEVLFLGAPTANHPGHDPVERYRVIRKQLGKDGINFTYTERLSDIRREVLDRYDAVLMYANWDQHGKMDPAQERALVDYVEAGGAFLPIHCASACFGDSEAFVRLVGGRFVSHGDGVFRTTITNPNHPVMRGYQSFEAWDETYVHDRHGDDRTILQKREDEPWTWVRNQGNGRVFYTAYGHDMRCWDQPGFHELLRRGILWSVGAEVRAKLTKLKLPELEMEEMLLPGYRNRRAITEGQAPLSPQESLKMAQIPVGYEISLFASEPDIVNPIYAAWDERGRAFVIETVDYPNNLHAGNTGNDRITICEDTNGDGKADKFTRFADKLSIPTAMVFANGGVICTNGPDMLFLQDTDGDDQADVRKVLFTGFNMGDTHAGVSNLRYGFDGWIYATIGYSGFRGQVGGERVEFSMGVFRFLPDGSKLEFLQGTTNNTWGLGFTSQFDILGSTANANPSWYFTMPRALYQQAGLSQPQTPRADFPANPLFFPSSTDIRQVDQFDRYTSAAGHGFYTSHRFPAQEYTDRIAFVTDPTGKLVAQFEVKQEGAGYKAAQLPNNLYSSADAWSGPVFAETGPDGAVWICDWYNIIIQHNPTPSVNSAGYDAKTGAGNAYETPLRDTKHGRIFRIYPKGTPNDEDPKLDAKNASSLIAALDHSNLFWRLHAQRLLVESKADAAIPPLKKLVAEDGDSALHAFYSLEGLGSVDQPLATAAAQSAHRGLRRAAIRWIPQYPAIAQAFWREGTVQAADSRELMEVFAALSSLPPSEAIGQALYATLASSRETILNDAPLSDGWQMAARRHAVGVLTAAAADPESSKSSLPPNLIPDGDFASGELGIWSLRSYGEERPGNAKLSVVPRGRNGSPALMIQSDTRADVGAGAVLTVKPTTRYRLSGWVKTEQVENRGGRGALLNIHATNVATKALSGTTDWTELSTEFTSGTDPQILIHCLFGGYGGSVGTAYFDEIRLSEVSAGDVSGVTKQVADHFLGNAGEEQRRALAEALAGRTEEFATNLLAALGTKPVELKPLVRRFAPDAEVHARGAAVYNKTCIACHGPDGKGVAGAFPPLDGSEWVTGDPSVPIRFILHGLQGAIEVGGQKYENIMAPLSELTDAEIADVMTYVRQSWQNDAAPVAAEEVKEVRAKYSSRNTFWTVEEVK